MIITVINYIGDSFVLSPSGNYFVEKITGLGPMNSTISRSKMGHHGTVFSAATLDERNIVIKLGLCQPVSENRRRLYDLFPSGLPVTLQFDDNNRHCTITGYVEQNEPDSFVSGPTAQISIICPDPFFVADPVTSAISSDGVIINSSCPFETGYKVSVEFTTDSIGFSITNKTTGKKLNMNTAFYSGDRLIVDTAERAVTLNGQNAFNEKDGDWALLEFGANEIAVSVPGNIEFTDRYIGL